MSGASEFTTEELMIAAISRELRDDELGFVGLGTAARAFTLAVGIPIAAARLAQLKQAPGFSIYWGNLLTPSLEAIPEALLQDAYTRWPAAASPADVGYKIDMVTRGRFDVSFESAPQVDRYGNQNIAAIGDYAKPRTQLLGYRGAPGNTINHTTSYWVPNHTPQVVCERVDTVCGIGYDRAAELGPVAARRGERLDHHIFVIAADDRHPAGIVALELDGAVDHPARIFTAIDQIADQDQMILAGAILTLFQQTLE